MRTKFILLCAVILFVPLALKPATEGMSRKTPTLEKPAGIEWIHNLEEGLAKAGQENKLLMIEFMASWCPSCQEMEKKTFSDSNVKAKVSAFVPVRIDIDQQRDVAENYNALAQKYGGIGIPNILFLASDGTKVKHIVGYQSPEEFLATLDSILAR